MDALALGRPHRDRLKELMNKKELVRMLTGSGSEGGGGGPAVWWWGGLPCDGARGGDGGGGLSIM